MQSEAVAGGAKCTWLRICTDKYVALGYEFGSLHCSHSNNNLFRVNIAELN